MCIFFMTKKNKIQIRRGYLASVLQSNKKPESIPGAFLAENGKPKSIPGVFWLKIENPKVYQGLFWLKIIPLKYTRGQISRP